MKATVKNKIFEGRKKGKELNPKKINFEKFPEKKKTRNKKNWQPNYPKWIPFYPF